MVAKDVSPGMQKWTLASAHFIDTPNKMNSLMSASVWYVHIVDRICNEAAAVTP